MNEKRFKYPAVSEIYSTFTRGSYAGIPIEDILKSKELHNKVIAHCTASAKDLWKMTIEILFQKTLKLI